MADAIKITLLFQQYDAGWSESFYFSVPPNYLVKDMIDELIEARRKVLGLGAFIIGGRGHNTSNPKNVEVYKYNKEGLAESPEGNGVALRYADQPHYAVGSPFKTSTGTRRLVTLSGFPDEYIKRTEADQFTYPHAHALTKLKAWDNYLQAAPSPLVIRARLRTGDFAPKDIDTITVHTDGRYKINYAGGANLVAGDKVVFSKVKGTNLTNLKGTRKVVEVIDANYFTVDRGPRQDLGAPIYLGGGKVSKVGHDFFVAARGKEPYLVTTRKRGRPFTARRGRRSASR